MTRALATAVLCVFRNALPDIPNLIKPLALIITLSASTLLAEEGAGSTTALAPGLKDYGQKEYVRVSKDLPHSESAPWKLVCTIPYNCHFQSWIEVEAEAGKIINFNSTNPLVLYLTKTESYTTRAGIQDYEAKNWVSGEGAIYTIPAGVTVRAVKYRETGSDTTFAGSFESNDSDYNTLWKKGARTAYICMREHFYDCPDRERVGFWGDGTPEQMAGNLRQCPDQEDLFELLLRPLGFRSSLHHGQTGIRPPPHARALPDDDPMQLHHAVGALRPLVGFPH